MTPLQQLVFVNVHAVNQYVIMLAMCFGIGISASASRAMNEAEGKQMMYFGSILTAAAIVAYILTS